MTDSRPNNSDFVVINNVTYSHEDMFKVIDTFYTRIQNDELLKVPFQSIHDWPDHIDRLTHFWWIKFGGKPYLIPYYNPVQKHFFAGFNEVLLDRWLKLFHQTLNESLRPEQAELWTAISSRMGHALSLKNEMFREHYEKTNHGVDSK